MLDVSDARFVAAVALPRVPDALTLSTEGSPR